MPSSRSVTELSFIACAFLLATSVDGKRANHDGNTSLTKPVLQAPNNGTENNSITFENVLLNANSSTNNTEKPSTPKNKKNGFRFPTIANASSIEEYYKNNPQNSTMLLKDQIENKTVIESPETSRDNSSTLQRNNTSSLLLLKPSQMENQIETTEAEQINNETKTVNLALDLEINIIASRSAHEYPSLVGNVLRKGKLSNFFRPCATVEEAAADEDVFPLSKRTCFRDSEYTDRIEFGFSYPASVLDSENGVFASVEVQQTEKSVANAIVPTQEFGLLSSAQPKRKVSVYYGCLTNGVQSYVLLFKMRNVTNEEVIKMTWEKTCLVGSPPDHVLVKSSYPSKESLLWPPTRDMKEVIVSPSEMSTSIEMSLGEEYNQQYFASPQINSSDTSTVIATLRGTESKGGTLHSTTPVKFNVVYACKGTGKSEIYFTAGIPPFANISFSWIKECGGIIPRNLNIGTEPHGSDIVYLGVVQEEYEMKDSELGLPHSEIRKHLESNLTHWKLHISTDTQMQEKDIKSFGVHMGHPVITVGDPFTVYASTSRIIKTSSSRGRSTYDYNDPTLILRDDEELEMTFSLVCSQIGESRIFISLPMLHYDPVEFGFVKVCNYVPKRKSRSSFNVRSIFKIFIILFAAVGVAVGFRAYKKWKDQIRYEGLYTEG